MCWLLALRQTVLAGSFPPINLSDIFHVSREWDQATGRARHFAPRLTPP